MSSKLSVAVACSLACLLTATIARAANAGQTAPAQYDPGGAETCLGCHDDAPGAALRLGPGKRLIPAQRILRTPHAVAADKRSPFGQHGCESCHGPSPDHIAQKMVGEALTLPTVVFKGPNVSSVTDRNQMCYACHEYGLRTNWRGSQHQRSDVACNDCHTIHADKDPVLVKASQSGRCFNCHPEQRAQANRLSHHPIIEGKVVCADCHNPHGSPQDKMLVRARINDTCYKCHADKRGPLLSEHAPVREDCTICHTPHGSTQVRLLRKRPPYLCQQCHDTSHHSGSPYGGETYLGGGRAPQPQTVSRGCLNCHSQVHGSNSPSGIYNLR